MPLGICVQLHPRLWDINNFLLEDLVFYDSSANIKGDAFFFQELPLFRNLRTRGVPGETVKRSVGRNHTVAGDLWREGIGAECSADGLRGSAADLPSDPAIGCDLSAWNARGRLVDLQLKAGGLRTGFHVGYFTTRRYGGGDWSGI